MHTFTKKDKLVSIIRENPNLLPVLDRFGISLGFGDKTVSDICLAQGIHTDFFLAIVNTFHHAHYFPENKLLSFSPLEIVEYLKKTHQYYLGKALPRIEELLSDLMESGTKGSADLKMIEIFYRNYREELIQHIREEEEKVFPYVIDLVTLGTKNKGFSGIHAFSKEHSNVETKLNDLKNLILKYITPDYDPFVCYEFLVALFRFEKDIIDHARIEDKILVPMVRAIENSL